MTIFSNLKTLIKVIYNDKESFAADSLEPYRKYQKTKKSGAFAAPSIYFFINKLGLLIVHNTAHSSGDIGRQHHYFRVGRGGYIFHSINILLSQKIHRG